MPDSAKPIYSVDAYSDPVVIRIEGRASFQNSSCLHDFFGEMLRQGKSRFILDFQQCASMDSTFLGVLAGAALQVRRQNPPGTIIVSRVGPRNLELIRNLGLHRLITVDLREQSDQISKDTTTLHCANRTELENARLVLEAHENLIATDESNRSKFQDVLTFLRNRVDHK